MLRLAVLLPDRKLTVIYENPGKLDFGQYAVRSVLLNGAVVVIDAISSTEVRIKRQLLATGRDNIVTVDLS